MRLSLSVWVVCAIAAQGHAQTLFHVKGDQVGQGLGVAVAGLGDVNGDAVPDFIVGSNTGGYARVYSGADAGELYTLSQPAVLNSFGRAVACTGDVDADGVADIAVGAPFDDAGGFLAGGVRVFSGVTGLLVFQVSGAGGDLLGSDVSSAGDVNGDGVPDILTGSQSNAAELRSGADGSVLISFAGGAASDEFGAAVAGLGDVNADGVPDLAFGAPGADGALPATGLVSVVSGATGVELYSIAGPMLGDEFGRSLARGGDVDLDGREDLVVGAPQGAGVGYAQLVSGATGATLFTAPGAAPGDRFGVSVGGGGDTDLDGVPDWIVGAEQQAFSAGYARILSGLDAAVLVEIAGAPGDRAGRSVAVIGDVNADTAADALLGAPDFDLFTDGPGSFEVLSVATDASPPAAPSGLTAIGQPGAVQLDWADDEEYDLSHYEVRRATVPGGPYAPIAAPVQASSYEDASVVVGTTYYYVVVAFDLVGNESPQGVEVSATPTAVCQSDLGFGNHPTAWLSVCGGSLATGSSATLSVMGVPATSQALLVAGFQNNPTSFGSLGGATLVPVPFSLVVVLPNAGTGTIEALVPGGGGPFSIYAQVVIADAGQIAATNAVELGFQP